jgi:hypothetical protein
MFNNKFDDKYKNVRKPVIVNGLREIIPYKQKLSQKINNDNITTQGPPEKKEEKPPLKTSISEEEIIIPIQDHTEETIDPEEQVKDEESVEPTP